MPSSASRAAYRRTVRSSAPSRLASSAPPRRWPACKSSSMASTRVVGCDTDHSINAGGICPVLTVAWSYPPVEGCTSMATFILVPGFWLGAWAWEAVTGELTAAGHDVHPVTLAGLGERAAEATPQVNVDTHIADLTRLIRERRLRDVVLVGHSGANMPVTGAADRLPEFVNRLVYVDTGPMPSGMASIEFRDPKAQQEVRDEVARHGDGWLLPVPRFDPEADPVNLAGLTGEHLEQMRTRGTPQPFGTVTQPLVR